MAYIPDATNTSQPADTVDRSTAALEFRTIKSYIQNMLATLTGLGAKVGDAKIWLGGAGQIEANWMIMPQVATTLSRAAYPVFHTVMQQAGYPYGNGDGSTTFGIPFMAADYTPVQANANAGTQTVGQVIAHTHPLTASLGNYGPRGGAGGEYWGAPVSAGNTGSTGGAANYAAGLRVLFIMKVL